MNRRKGKGTLLVRNSAKVHHEEELDKKDVRQWRVTEKRKRVDESGRYKSLGKEKVDNLYEGGTT